MASYSYWWRSTRTGGELLVLVASQWRVVLLVASGPTGGEWSYWRRATRTGGELLVLVASQWRVVLLVASGPTGGEWSFWWRATRTGGEPMATCCRRSASSQSVMMPGCDLGITDRDFVSVGLVLGQFRVSLRLV